MDVTVNSASRDDQSFGSADVRIGSDYKLGMHPVHDAGIACLTDTRNQTVLHSNVGLDDAEHRINDRGIRDHQIERTVRRCDVTVTASANSQSFARSEDKFVARV
jgi:hypothetical protein